MIRPLAFASLLVASAAFAQAPHDDWRTIATPHFRVHYPAAYEAWATRAASRLESVREAVVTEVGFSPATVTDVLVMNPEALPNGITLPLLDTPRIVLYTEPPGPEIQIGEYRDWIDLLAVHETAHLIHLLRPSRNPFDRALSHLVPLNPITLHAPRWVLEGYATVIEGRLTGSGRPSGAMRAAVLRTWAASGQLPTYAQLASDRRFLGMSMAYLAGSAFLEWLVERSGPDSLRHLWARMTARQRRSFDSAFEGVFGDTPSRLYGVFAAEVTERALRLAGAGGREPRTGAAEDSTRSSAAPGPRPPAPEGELWLATTRNSGDPAVSPDGKQIAVVLRDAKGEARLAVYSTSGDEEEAKRQKQIAEMLRRDPEDVAPVAGLAPRRKPLHQFTPPDGGDVDAPRWTRDGAALLYTHRVDDRDGVKHHDLFRWTPATGRNERITHLADVKEADPVDAARAIAVRSRFGASQLVYVDLATGAITPYNEPSLDVVYSHPRAARDGRIAWAQHRGGEWHVAVEGKELPQAGAFSPEWAADGALFAAVAAGGFIDIVKDGVAVTRTGSMAMQPAPSPDGSLFYMSLDPDGFVVRRLADPSPAPPRAVAFDPSLVPALPPPPATPVTLRSEPVTSRPYGIGRQELSTTFGGQYTAFGRTTELGVRIGDVVGRLDTLALAAIGDERGAAVASTWRGWPVDIGAHVFTNSRTRGLELRTSMNVARSAGRWPAVSPAATPAFAREGRPAAGDTAGVAAGATKLAFGALATRGGTRAFGEVHAMARQRRIAEEHVEIAADSRRHAQATLRVRTQLVGAEATFGRNVAVGGAASSIEPDSLLIGRILDPALERGTLRGRSYRGEKLTLGSGAVAGFWQRHHLGRDVDVYGLESSIAVAPTPLLKLPALELTAGVARLRQIGRTRGWLALRWQP